MGEWCGAVILTPAPNHPPPLYLAHVDACIEWIDTIGTLLGSVAELRDKCVDCETGNTNGKTAVLRDKRGEQRKEEEDDMELVEG